MEHLSAEILGALVSILMLWVITGVLVYSGVQRIESGDYEINATIMLITSGTGVFFNIVWVYSAVNYATSDNSFWKCVFVFIFRENSHKLWKQHKNLNKKLFIRVLRTYKAFKYNKRKLLFVWFLSQGLRCFLVFVKLHGCVSVWQSHCTSTTMVTGTVTVTVMVTVTAVPTASSLSPIHLCCHQKMVAPV